MSGADTNAPVNAEVRDASALLGDSKPPQRLDGTASGPRPACAAADHRNALLHAVEIEIAADHPAFDGHFPGNSLLPGVVLLAEVLEAAAAEPDLALRIGRAPRIGQVKFLGAVAPGARLAIRFAVASNGLRFDVGIVAAEGERDAATGLIERAPDAGGVASS